MSVDGDSVSSPVSTAIRQALTDVLLVQADAEDANCEDAITCSDREGGGIVLTGKKAPAVAEHLLRQRHYARPILLDRGRYAGTARTSAASAFDTDWISRQRDLGLPIVMPDAGFVGEGDLPGLISILDRVGELGPDALAPLGLHLSWLDAKKNLGTLVDSVTTAGVPIAVALEHTGDPLGVKSAVYGLVALLQAPVPVVLLRCDTSALGALAYGATAAAVGTRSALRHVYPLSDKPSGPFNPPKPAAIVRGCLSYVHLDKIDLTAQADPDDPTWWCGCPACGESPLTWLASAPDPETQAFLHSLETLYRIQADIAGANADLSIRRQSWTEQCSHALFHHETIKRTLYAWEPPKHLGHWVARGNDTTDLSEPARRRGPRR